MFGASDTAKLKSEIPGCCSTTRPRAGWPTTIGRCRPTTRAPAANAFFLRDITAATTPFSVAAGAPTDALKVQSAGNVGIGTDAPGLDLSIRAGDTPAVRLEQSTSGGFTAQTWDVAGNEANFFVRDLTGGSRLPFRIRPGAATSRSTSRRTRTSASAPARRRPARRGQDRRDRPDAAAGQQRPVVAALREHRRRRQNVDIGGGATNFTVGPAVGDPALTVAPGGQATTGGVVQQSTATENAAAVDVADVLAKLRALPVMKSELTSDAANALHLSPAGADFRAAFGLGSSDAAIAPSDMAGVALVGVQALATQVDAIDTSRVGALATRIDAIEKTIAAPRPRPRSSRRRSPRYRSAHPDRAAHPIQDGDPKAHRQISSRTARWPSA